MTCIYIKYEYSGSDFSPMSEQYPLKWGAKTAAERGPVVLELDDPVRGNAFGLHSDLYGFQTAMAKTLRYIDPAHKANLDHTDPTINYGPFKTWKNPHLIVTVDPWGHRIIHDHLALLKEGVPIMPSAAVNRSYYRMPEIVEAVRAGRLQSDGERPKDKDADDRVVLDKDGVFKVTEITGEQVWHLPGVAKLLNMKEETLRESMHKHSNRMFPQLIDRPDLKVFLPPIGGHSILIFGDTRKIGDPTVPVVLRPHDTCDDGDLGALRCTCRDYLIYAIEQCIQNAQAGGLGYIFKYVAQGRGFGSVPKHLVYQKREQQPQGDQASRYFDCTKEVMGGKDGRMDWAKVGPMLALNIRRIHTLLTMSPHKIGPMVDMGIHIDKAHPLPKDRISDRASLEIAAKVADGYYEVDAILNGH